MKYLIDNSRYEKIALSINSFLLRDKVFPDQVFNSNYRLFRFFDFDLIFTKEFYSRIFEVLKNLGELEFNFSVLDPDPKEYFFKYFNKYSVIEIKTNEPSKIIDLLFSDPGDSPADSIVNNSNTIVLWNKNKSFVIYCDREYELCVCAFSDNKSKVVFDEYFNNELIQIDSLHSFLSPLGFDDIDSEVSKIYRNYDI